MTIEEKSKRIKKWCESHGNCDGSCPISTYNNPDKTTCYSICSPEDTICVEKNYEILFGQEGQGNDSVKHPSHYTSGKIEVWDFIADQKLNYDRGCAIKYICRAGKKDPEKEIEDLQKAANYIHHEIKMLKGENENGTDNQG